MAITNGSINGHTAGKKLRIAVIPGDGIGQEVIPEGIACIKAAAKSMLPEGWKETLLQYDSIFFGAVGDPARVPDHISLWGSLIQFRREFDQYISLHVPGTDREFVVQDTIMTRQGVDRVLKYAFDLAQKRPRKKLTSATKSNGISISMPYWDERVKEMSQRYPDVAVDKYHIDILTAFFVLRPEAFDVVNLFGDILSDLGPACTGSIGVAPSGNINPEGKFPSLFEPVHGSAPDIVGKGIANPIGAIWAGQMMLEHYGHKEAADKMMQAIEVALEQGGAGVITPDLGGKGTCVGLGGHIAKLIETL
ncbi:hypothetical protein IAU60_003175 [Kwoniella sp. DSM 27419]